MRSLVMARPCSFRCPAWLGRGVPALAVGLVLGSCAPATNLLSLTGPRFEGRHAPRPGPGASADSLIRVVTFNIKFAREIDRAIEVLQGDSLRGADILALQEMDESGAERIARALGYDYVFYPAVIHPASGRYFGPALLSRWPIERSWKVILPHAGLDPGPAAHRDRRRPPGSRHRRPGLRGAPGDPGPDQRRGAEGSGAGPARRMRRCGAARS